MKTLKPFQRIAVDFIKSRKHCLLADVMGLGKTFSAISALNELLPKTVLIVCPASIKQQWQNALDSDAAIWYDESKIAKGRSYAILSNVMIINYDILTSKKVLDLLKSVRWDVAIYDEVHYCKSMDAKRTRAVFGKDGIVHCCDRNILLTGTPILNRPVELFPLLTVLAPDVLGKENTFDKFGKMFCNGWWDGYELNVSGSSNEPELNERLKKAFMLRRTEKEVELQLPEKRHQIFVLDKSEDTVLKLDMLERHDFKKQRFDTVTPIATIRREVAEQKMERALPIIKDVLSQIDKLVIFAYHTSVIDKLMAELGASAVKIDGGCSQLKRQEALKTFKQTKEVKVLVGQITAAGQGLDGMQDVCNHVMFLETSWTPAEIQQAIARVYRMGQTKSVLVQFVVWEKSVEEHMLRTALDKIEVIKKIVG
jgi:SWI/SNF-related matrix-associated actin-dependent regulator 1 of chromatin subfamily A